MLGIYLRLPHQMGQAGVCFILIRQRCNSSICMQPQKRKRNFRLIGIVASGLLAIIVSSSVASHAAHLAFDLRAQAQRQRPLKNRAPASKKPRIDYSKFSHSTHLGSQKLACESCHKFPTSNWKEVRKGDAAFADVAEFPEHSTCLNCHRTQFFARERPAPAICSNCHVNVTPRDTTRFLFPSLGDVADSSKVKRNVESEFLINFPHDKHADVVSRILTNSPSQFGFVAISWRGLIPGQDPGGPKSCPVCHQTYQPQGKSDDEYVTKPPKNLGDAFWLKKGTFKTAPNSHTVCFSCHNADMGIPPAQNECGTCHQQAPPQPAQKQDFDTKLAETIGVADETVLMAWRDRMSAGAFRHEGGEHPNLSCLTCHNVNAISSLSARNSMVPLTSCGGAEGCHITATADEGGILNYEIDQRKSNSSFVCTKCHISFGKEAVPSSHLQAVLSPKK